MVITDLVCTIMPGCANKNMDFIKQPLNLLNSLHKITITRRIRNAKRLGEGEAGNLKSSQVTNKFELC